MRTPLNTIRRHISYANVTASLAIFAALGGVSYAAAVLPANSVGTPQLKANSVTSKKIKDSSLLASDFKAGQLPAGVPGPQGERGPAGPAGERGPAGPTGAQGEKGPIGDTGPIGPRGEVGPEGVRGPKGDTGATGATGAKGEKGTTGATGPQGPKGDTGATGPQGVQGAAGGVNGYQIVKNGPLQVNPGAGREAIAECPAGTNALGGGVSSGEGNGSEPIVLKSVPVSQANGRMSWHGGVFNPGGMTEEFTVFAICAFTA